MKINMTRPILGVFILLLIGLAPLSAHAQQDTASKHIVLLIGDHPGVDEVDAQSAALLIATEFRKLGVDVSDPVYETPITAEFYHVTFRRLGEKVLVHLTKQTPSGTTVIERQLWIANIEEMIKVAPRLVDAIVHDKPVESTVDVETITGHEAAELQKIAGESLWGIGIFGTSIPGADVGTEAGYEFGWSYETSKYAVGTEFRRSENDNFMFVSWSIGGRYFLNNKNITPYIGGGFSVFDGHYRTKTENEFFIFEWEDYDTEGDRGLGVYLVGGIEMFRLTRSRLKLELRVDRPLFSFPNQDMMPVTLGIFFSQHYAPNRSGCWW